MIFSLSFYQDFSFEVGAERNNVAKVIRSYKKGALYHCDNKTANVSLNVGTSALLLSIQDDR